jgi:hypothetical protein
LDGFLLGVDTVIAFFVFLLFCLLLLQFFSVTGSFSSGEDGVLKEGTPVITQVEKHIKKRNKKKKGKEDISKGSIQEKNSMLWKLKLVSFKK